MSNTNPEYTELQEIKAIGQHDRAFEVSIDWYRENGEINETINVRVEGDDAEVTTNAALRMAEFVRAWRDETAGSDR